MGKKQKKVRPPAFKPAPKDEENGGTSLKELLSADVIGKLKAQAEDLKQAEASRREEIRKQEEEEKRREQKLLENDFAYLLEHSDPNGSKHK